MAFAVCHYCGFWIPCRKMSRRRHCRCFRARYCDRLCMRRDLPQHQESCVHRVLTHEAGLPALAADIICDFARERGV